ncbi:MAG: DUF6361 family protein [Dehalococcoidia bacterium]
MLSSLAWLDHDAAAQERTKRILALFQERGTQDQLGLGAVRDSFADLMFPGTSTIQTRLRYFLFVPWIYTRLEQNQVPARRFGAEAREQELALLKPLLSSQEEGVFGRMAGGDLKRLPSDVYWGGLESWGIREMPASRSRYHQGIDEVYRRRKLARRHSSEGTEDDPGVRTWHPELPPPPTTFPEHATLSLTVDEAMFLRDRIVARHRDSHLAWLVLHPMPTNVHFFWEHPLAHALPAEQRKLLRHAQLFSETMAGAPILYNRMLAELAGREELSREYREAHDKWLALLDGDAVEAWSLDEALLLARSQGSHSISAQTEEFVRRWLRLVRTDPASLFKNEEARSLIRNREMLLKGARSLFRNRVALQQRYQGGLGMGQLSYRWANVQVHLNDLCDGLESG